MRLIYKTKEFNVVAAEKPLIDRKEGGHIVIYPNIRSVDRTQLEPKKAIKLMKLTMLIGKATTLGLKKRGINIGRINYQDNGNWNMHLHIHVFGRARTAKIQKWREPVYFPPKKTGFYKGFKPLNKQDIAEIRKQIKILLKKPKYKDSEWGIS
jgi:diadenosine tetraphosphate (Ap4A) HIT family hydrolase